MKPFCERLLSVGCDRSPLLFGAVWWRDVDTSASPCTASPWETGTPEIKALLQLASPGSERSRVNSCSVDALPMSSVITRAALKQGRRKWETSRLIGGNGEKQEVILMSRRVASVYQTSVLASITVPPFLLMGGGVWGRGEGWGWGWGWERVLGSHCAVALLEISRDRGQRATALHIRNILEGSRFGSVCSCNQASGFNSLWTEFSKKDCSQCMGTKQINNKQQPQVNNYGTLITGWLTESVLRWRQHLTSFYLSSRNIEEPNNKMR